MNFNNKTILITGASTGIGYELALQLSEYNCNLILTARRKELLDELSRKIFSKCKVISYQSDVSDKTSVKHAYEIAISEFGKIDIAILNAGIDQKTRITNFNSGDAEITMGVNFF